MKKKKENSLSAAGELVETIIKNRTINYPLYVGISFVLFVFIYSFYKDSNLYNRLSLELQQFTILLIFVSCLKIVWGLSKITIKPQYRAQILFLNTQTGVWLEEGTYFVFFQKWGLFKVYTEEIQHEEKKDIIVEEFPCQDKKGKKIFVAMNGDYSIGPTDEDAEKYQRLDEKTVKTNLQTLLSRTAKRVLGGKEFWDEILNKELHKYFEDDEVFKEELFKYGIVFNSLIVEAYSGNIPQDEINQQKDRLVEKKKASYPVGYQFSHKELQEIDQQIMIELKITKSYDIKGSALPRLILEDEHDSHDDTALKSSINKNLNKK